MPRKKTGKHASGEKNLTFRELQIQFGTKLRLMRLAYGLTQHQLAVAAKLDRTLISRIERGIANPTLDVLSRLAHAFEIDTVDLFK
jgi:transcriptional regulator with XRE-family HTH domain